MLSSGWVSTITRRVPAGIVTVCSASFVGCDPDCCATGESGRPPKKGLCGYRASECVSKRIAARSPSTQVAGAERPAIVPGLTGQVLVPFLASLIAVAAGMAGILLVIAFTLAASGTAVRLRWRQK